MIQQKRDDKDIMIEKVVCGQFGHKFVQFIYDQNKVVVKFALFCSQCGKGVFL